MWQFTQGWNPRWHSTISASPRNALQLRSKQFLLSNQSSAVQGYAFWNLTPKMFPFIRSMNTFLIIYLVILLFEAILSTILKYAWQAEEKWNEPFYNQKTEQEKNSSPVSLQWSLNQKYFIFCFLFPSFVSHSESQIIIY